MLTGLSVCVGRSWFRLGCGFDGFDCVVVPDSVVLEGVKVSANRDFGVDGIVLR